jgi:hypothetical protein
VKHLFHLAIFLLFAFPAFAEHDTPEALVTALYEQHKTETPFFQTASRRLLDAYFAKPLADLIWKDALLSRGEVGAIGADPLFDAQDFEIKNLVIHPAEIGDDTALVTVTFDNFGENRKIVYTLVLANDAWRISDLRYGKDRTLLGLLKETYTK